MLMTQKCVVVLSVDRYECASLWQMLWIDVLEVFYIYINIYFIFMSAFRTVKSYWISKGSSFSTTITKQETELTPEMISS